MFDSVSSWPTYRFLRRQVRWSHILISLRSFHILLCSTQRHLCSQWSRSRCFSGIPLLSLWSNECWQFAFRFLCLLETQLVHLGILVYVLLKPSLKDFEHNLTSMWIEHNCTGGGNGKSLQYSCHENPMASMKIMSNPSFLTLVPLSFHKMSSLVWEIEKETNQ